jgi:hypothetical protein
MALSPIPASGSIFDKAPGLSFTKVLSAQVDGQSLSKPNWAGVLLVMIGALKKRGLFGERLVRALEIPTRAKPYEEEGYRYCPELGISVQGQSAQDAWKEARRIAEKHAIPLEVTFRWRDHKKALYPGKTGVLRYPIEKRDAERMKTLDELARLGQEFDAS